MNPYHTDFRTEHIRQLHHAQLENDAKNSQSECITQHKPPCHKSRYNIHSTIALQKYKALSEQKAENQHKTSAKARYVARKQGTATGLPFDLNR